jgi:hypothetical protein
MAKKEEKIEKRKIVQTLKVKLTRTELLEAGDEMSKSILEKERLERELDGIKKQFKGDISRQDSILQKNKDLVNNKYEFRSVECLEEKDFENCTYVIIRLDTGEIVSGPRKLKDSEMQQSLKIEDSVAV